MFEKRWAINKGYMYGSRNPDCCAMFTTGIVLKICMQHIEVCLPVLYNKPKPMIFGLEAGVFGLESFYPAYPTA